MQFITVCLIFVLSAGSIKPPKADTYALRLTYAKIYYSIFVPTTYFVRPLGGTSTQCTGKADTNYPGSGTEQNCAYNDFQVAWNSITFGDTIKIQAGAAISTTPDYAFGEFQLTSKGVPPTNTDLDYMTITTNDLSGTPSILTSSGYPQFRTKVTTAMAANMPKVVAEGSTPLFRLRKNLKYVRIERLNITNDGTNGWQTINFIDNEAINTLAEVPRKIDIRYNWIHPYEEDGSPLSDTNKNRSAENAIFISAIDVNITNNAIQGFVGRVRYGGNIGSRMTSAGILSSYLKNANIKNNLLQAWTYNIFLGGSAMPDWTVTDGGTIVNCTSNTVCLFSTVNNLNVGDPFAIKVTSTNTWGSAFVQNIAGNTVTFDRPVCHSYDGNNTCVTIIGNPTPATGDPIRWKGIQPDNIAIERNLILHDSEWPTFMNNDCGGKGYGELKSGTNIRINGNILSGCTGFTITVRNQVGDFPFASLDNLQLTNNVMENASRMFVGYFRDTTPTAKTRNVTYSNNLILGVNGNELAGIPGGEFSSNTGGVVNLTIEHNTVAWNKITHPGFSLTAWHNFIGFFTVGGYNNTVENFVMRNNIFPMGQNSCFDGANMLACWPNSSNTIRSNVLLNVDNHDSFNINQWWTTPFPNNIFITSYSTVQFENLTYDKTGDHRLKTSSPYHNAATDGKDMGVDFVALNSALGFTYAAISGGGTKCNWHTTTICN